MARTIKNKNVVYTGKVGAKMKPRRIATSSKRTPKSMFRCMDGPWKDIYFACKRTAAHCQSALKANSGIMPRKTT